MKYFQKYLLRSPTILGIGLMATASLYSYKQWGEPVIPPALVEAAMEGSSSYPTNGKYFVFAWSDRGQDLSRAQIQQILEQRLEKKVKPQAGALAKHIVRMSKAHEISPSLILAVIQAESSFRLHAKSYVGATGLMQLRPSTAKYIAKLDKIKNYKSAADLKDPMINIEVGVAYLAYLRNRFANPTHYVAAYNLGPTTVGRMLDEERFALGKVTKYVTEIHDGALGLRHQPQIWLARN